MIRDEPVRRRDLLGGAMAALALGSCASAAEPATPEQPAAAASGRLPTTIAGMTLRQLRDDFHDRLFRQYLPFWEKGAIDQQFGGFLCELNDDGSVASDEKYSWYQGRGLWVYSFLFNEFGKDPRWLKIAQRGRDFMVRKLYAGEGRWHERLRRDGTMIEGVGGTVYGALFAALGLGEYYLAAGREEDLELVKTTLTAAVAAYDDRRYNDTHTTLYTSVKPSFTGFRTQGHSMVLVTILSRLVARCPDPLFRRLLDEHVDRIVNKFWNPDYGIVNEMLDHDYGRIPLTADHMFAGHSLETLWIVVQEAVRRKDRAMFDTLVGRIHRLIEMCWDYVFEGWGDGNFFVFQSPQHSIGPEYDIKTMWAQCEVLVACMLVLEYTGQPWAKEWYDRTRAFALRALPSPAPGVWRQAVNRQGQDIQRAGISTKRKDNFHQVRYLMFNLLSLDRMLKNDGRPTPFPA